MASRAAPPDDLTRLTLEEIARLAAAASHPPVADWNPARRGDSEMRIARDGTWYHQGDPIRRAAMVRLFSTILRREGDGSHVLVTPAECLSIAVEDTPFHAVELKSEGAGRERRLGFRLATGDLIVAGRDHPLTFAQRGGEPVPGLVVRGGMEARVSRAVFLELAGLALEEGDDPPCLWSDGVCFSMAALL
jgi:hypothetical protein